MVVVVLEGLFAPMAGGLSRHGHDVAHGRSRGKCVDHGSWMQKVIIFVRSKKRLLRECGVRLIDLRYD